MADLKNYLSSLRDQMREEEEAVRAAIRKEWQDLFIRAYELAPNYLQEYVDFSVADEIQAANSYPRDSRKGGGTRSILINIPDFPPIYMQITWADINKSWNVDHYWMRRIGAIELENGHWVPKYNQSGIYTNTSLDEVFKEAILERDYVNAILDTAERQYPDGAPGPGCKDRQFYHNLDEFPHIQRRGRMKLPK